MTDTSREALIKAIKHELAEFAHNKVLETLLLDSVEMLEADDKVQQVQAVEPDAWLYRDEEGDLCAEDDRPSNPDFYRPVFFHPAPPATDAIGWQDMYLKAKSEKEAMAAKYEKDIGPLAKVVPAFGERAELVARLRDIFKNEWGNDALREAANMLEADAQQRSKPHGHCTHPKCKDIFGAYLDAMERLAKYEPGATMHLNSAQQVAVPELMTDIEVLRAARTVQSVYERVPHRDVIEFARAIERAHGIGLKP